MHLPNLCEFPVAILIWVGHPNQSIKAACANWRECLATRPDRSRGNVRSRFTTLWSVEPKRWVMYRTGGRECSWWVTCVVVVGVFFFKIATRFSCKKQHNGQRLPCCKLSRYVLIWYNEITCNSMYIYIYSYTHNTYSYITMDPSVLNIF